MGWAHRDRWHGRACAISAARDVAAFLAFHLMRRIALFATPRPAASFDVDLPQGIPPNRSISSSGDPAAVLGVTVRTDGFDALRTAGIRDRDAAMLVRTQPVQAVVSQSTKNGLFTLPIAGEAPVASVGFAPTSWAAPEAPPPPPSPPKAALPVAWQGPLPEARLAGAPYNKALSTVAPSTMAVSVRDQCQATRWLPTLGMRLILSSCSWMTLLQIVTVLSVLPARAVASDPEPSLKLLTNSGSKENSDGCQRSSLAVALDVGHDRTHPGATSARGVSEYEYNLALGRLVLNTLQAAGFTKAFLVNESGEPVPLARRPEVARQAHAALFISLHHDSVQPVYLSQWVVDGQTHRFSDTYKGFSIFISKTSRWSEASLAFATNLGLALVAQGLAPSLHHAIVIKGENRRLLNRDLGIYAFDELVVLRNATMPALLLESAIIVNRDEEQAIQSGTHEAKVVSAILIAVTKFCSNEHISEHLLHP